MIFGRFRKRKAEPEIEEVLRPEQEAEQIAKKLKPIRRRKKAG